MVSVGLATTVPQILIADFRRLPRVLPDDERGDGGRPADYARPRPVEAAAPLSRAKLLGCRVAITGLIAPIVFGVIYAVAVAAFGVRVEWGGVAGTGTPESSSPIRMATTASSARLLTFNLAIKPRN